MQIKKKRNMWEKREMIRKKREMRGGTCGCGGNITEREGGGRRWDLLYSPLRD
jgi:hypothetical protein